MEFTFRPLPMWPHPATPYSLQRERPFSASWAQTMDLLEREVGYLGGRAVVLGVGLEPYDIRLDGKPRANARSYRHQGVEVSFDTRKHGRLTYATDVCTLWQDNVRSIALGLEALRAVDRYGISARGQQYAGFAALPMGGPDPEKGRRLVESAGGVKQALLRHHPDHGGDPSEFAHVQAYRATQGDD